MKRILLGLAAGLMMTGTSLVFAQTSPAPTPAPEKPSVKPSEPPAVKPTEPPVAKSTESPAAKATGMQWYSHQADEMRASKLIGTKVVNTANETIGDVNEIVLTKDGKVAAIVLGIGGFLGMGEREVAVNFSSLKMSRDQNNNLVLTVNATKENLKDAPAWRWDDNTKK